MVEETKYLGSIEWRNKQLRQWQIQINKPKAHTLKENSRGELLSKQRKRTRSKKETHMNKGGLGKVRSVFHCAKHQFFKPEALFLTPLFTQDYCSLIHVSSFRDRNYQKYFQSCSPLHDRKLISHIFFRVMYITTGLILAEFIFTGYLWLYCLSSQPCHTQRGACGHIT